MSFFEVPTCSMPRRIAGLEGERDCLGIMCNVPGGWDLRCVRCGNVEKGGRWRWIWAGRTGYLPTLHEVMGWALIAHAIGEYRETVCLGCGVRTDVVRFCWRCV